MSEPRFIVGHGLRREGKGHDAAGRFTDAGNGRGKCRCGLLSDPLPSVAARKRWHRTHKQDALNERKVAAVEAWSTAHPLGSPVRYWPGEKRGPGRESVTRSPAWAMHSGEIVVKVDGYAGGIAVTHVDPIEVTS